MMERVARAGLAGDVTAWREALSWTKRRGDREMCLRLLRIERDRTGHTWDAPEDLTPPVWHGVTLSWDACLARLFAADCAARMWHLYGNAMTHDVRTREAIKVARAYARGEATPQQLETARADAWAQACAVSYAVWGPMGQGVRDPRAFAGMAARCASWVACVPARVPAIWRSMGGGNHPWGRERLAKYLLGEVS